MWMLEELNENKIITTSTIHLIIVLIKTFSYIANNKKNKKNLSDWLPIIQLRGLEMLHSPAS